jgi:hypothetical protein
MPWWSWILKTGGDVRCSERLLHTNQLQTGSAPGCICLVAQLGCIHHVPAHRQDLSNLRRPHTHTHRNEKYWWFAHSDTAIATCLTEFLLLKYSVRYQVRQFGQLGCKSAGANIWRFGIMFAFAKCSYCTVDWVLLGARTKREKTVKWVPFDVAKVRFCQEKKTVVGLRIYC